VLKVDKRGIVGHGAIRALLDLDSRRLANLEDVLNKAFDRRVIGVASWQRHNAEATSKLGQKGNDRLLHIE